MPFIKVQKLVRNEDGTVKSGSAAIMDTVYVKDGKYHSKQVQRERLGKVVDLDPSGRRGIFRSPTRGLVRYDADTDEFAEASEGETIVIKKPAGTHVVFGDAYAFLELARASGVLASMRRAVPDVQSFESILIRAAKDFSSPFVPSDAFMARSFISSVLKDADKTAAMGAEKSRKAFFKEFCPKPPEMVSDVASYDSPHVILGVSEGRTVWCDSVVDTSRWTAPEGVQLAVLSQDYVSAQLFKNYDSDSPLTFIASMPAKKGLPYKESCQKALKHVGEKECTYEMNGREYFGVRKKAEVFGKKAFAYVYADMGGSGVPMPSFTVLLSNKSMRPDAVMEAFMSALRSEASVRRGGTFDSSFEKVRGLALCGIASRIMRDEVRKVVEAAGIKTLDLVGYAQAVMCSVEDGKVCVEAPGKLSGAAFSKIGVKVPSELDIGEYHESLISP